MSFQLHTKERCVERDGKVYSLTPKEFGILQFLMEHPDEVFTPEEIYENAWEDIPYCCKPIISVHIRHIRQKVEKDPSNPTQIISYWKKGYGFRFQ